MIVFGGYSSGNLINEVWALSLSGAPAWTQLTPSGTPPGVREGHSAIYDPVRDRIVVFGGAGYPDWFNDVWVLTLSGPPAWSQLVPTGMLPRKRVATSAVYDPVRDRMVVFGGLWSGAGYRLNDVWALTMSGTPTWNELTPAGTPPAARSGHQTIYDPVRDRMVVFGGSIGSRCLNDVWTLTLSESPIWSELAPAGSLPQERQDGPAIYDELNDRMVVFGGGYDNGWRNDTWALTFSGSPTWSQLAPTGGLPEDRNGTSAIYDPVRRRMVVFGGFNGVPDYHTLNDTWALALSGSPAWVPLAASGTPPSGRYYPRAFHDPVRDRMVVFGGYASASLNDVWSLSLAGALAWTELTPTGTPPSVREEPSAIYDPLRDRMLVFGGQEGPGIYLNDVWSLSLAGTPAWTELTPTGTPPSARSRHTAIYDPVGDRMVVFGGYGPNSCPNDTWALSLAGTPAWTELAPTGPLPYGRVDHSAIYDPVRARMVVFAGGLYGPGPGNDVWALTLAGTPAWTELTPAGTPPTPRYMHSTIYDPVRDRMIVRDGWTGSTYANDLWALSLADTPTWTELTPAGTPPSPRGAHSAVYDPSRDRMLVFGGGGFAGALNDTWALEWGSSSASPLFGAAVDFGTGSSPFSVAIGDLNGDVNPDLAVANAGSNTVSVLLGNGNGSFGTKTDFATGNSPSSVAIGDLNGDGNADLATANYWAHTVSVLLGNGNGSFGTKTDYGTGDGPYSVAIGDLNGDGKPDLAVANELSLSNTVSVLLGDGKGSFGTKTDYGTGGNPFSVAIGDLNGDGNPDLAVANYSSRTVSMLLGNGNGSFGTKTDFATGNSPSSVAIGDLNGDGNPDLATTNVASNTVSVLLGNGNGSFGTKTDFATGNYPYSMVIGDLNGDGKPDLAAANCVSNTVSVLLGNGNGSFGTKTDYGTGVNSYSVAIGDLNGDGRPDLAAANNISNTVSVLLNASSTIFPVPAPSNLTAVPQDCGQEVRLAWVDHSWGTASHVVESRYDGLPSPFTTLTTVLPGTASYLDTRADGLPHAYRVRAIRGGLYSPYSNEARSGFAPYAGVPPAPSSVTAKSVGDGATIRVRVGPPAGTTSWSGIFAVVLTASTDPAFGTDEEMSQSVVALEHNEVVLTYSGTQNTTYYFRARFLDQCAHNSPRSETVTAVPRYAPVVLVHGICGNGSDWNRGSWNWPSDLDTRCMIMDMEPKGASWTTWEMPLHDAIATKLAGEWSGDEKVDIVAYSQGGLASRGMIEQLDGASMVRNLVMLGTPNHGGMFATLAHYVSLIPNWNCHVEWPASLPGNSDLEGGAPVLNWLNYGRFRVDGEGQLTRSCQHHGVEDIDMGAGATGPGGVQYWTVAGTGGFLGSALYWFTDLPHVCVSDGVVPAYSVELAALASSHQYFDADLPGVGYLEHTGGLSGGLATPIQGSRPLAGHVANILRGSPPTKSTYAMAGRKAVDDAASEPVTCVGAFLDTMPAGGAVARSVNVDQCDSLSLLVSWPDTALSIALENPSGVVYTPSDTASTPQLHFEWSNEIGYAAFRVRTPLAGRWIARATGNFSGEPEAIRSFWGVSGTAYQAQATVGQDSVAAGTINHVYLQMTKAGDLIPVVATGAVLSPSGSRVPCVFRDDGTGGDALAGDLNYTTEISAGAENGQWTVDIDAASLPSTDGVIHRNVTTTFLVHHVPLLSIVPGTFSASPSAPMLGNSVHVSARILNSGPAADPALKIELHDLSTGELVASLRSSLAASETTSVDVPWSPSAGGVHFLELRAYSATGFARAWPETLGVLVQPGGVLAVEKPTAPALNFLRQPAPNPFTGTTTVEFSVARAGHVEIGVYDVSGRLVRRLLDGEQRAGAQKIFWNGVSDSGAKLGAGVYFVRLVAPAFRVTRKSVLIR
jgi:hypothetical protein